MEDEIQALLERNKRVEADKAWETSLTRRGFIVLITYACALFFFWINDLPKPALQALIPSGAYVLSTLTLPPLKKWWLTERYRRRSDARENASW